MTRVTRILCSVAVLLALAAPAAGQGALAPIGITQLNASGSGPCNGCVIHSFASGTTTPLATYADASLSTSNGTSVTLDSAGRAVIYLDSRLAYKLVLRTAAGSDIWTRDGIVGQLSGVITAQAANTRGIQVSRPSADAGISIQSSGGSGKTYGLVSNTSGGFRIQDDSDSTPRLEFLNDNITATLTGTFSLPTGLFSVGGFGTHVVSGSGTGTMRFQSRNTASGTANRASFDVGNNTSADLGRFIGLSSTHTASGYLQPSGVVLEANGSGGLSIATTDAAGDIRFYAGAAITERMSISDTGTVMIPSLTVTSLTLSAPGFLAYNSALRGVATGGTVTFDTEVYDELGSFAANTFTAPSTGRYLLCATVTYSDNSASSYGLRIVTTARTYQIDTINPTSAGVTSGCVHADMAASATASVQVLTGDIDIDIEGGASPMVTFFSGRLVP